MVRKKRMHPVLVCFLILFVLAATAAVCFVGKGFFLYWEKTREEPVSDKVQAIEAREDYVPFEELPEIYVQAVVAAEDRRFFSHNGVDIISIGRALWVDITTLSFREGGSTLTQQLGKNLYFTQDKEIERKIAEVFLAWEMEKVCEKEEILALYANTVYFGSGFYGISAAAQGYFGCQVQDLTDSQAVMLAGLPNAPSVYSPFENPTLALERMGQVIDSMVECGYITKDEGEALLAQQK